MMEEPDYFIAWANSAQGAGLGITYPYDKQAATVGNGTMVDYLNWEVEACRKNGVSFIDNYYGAITMEDTDCLTDGYHLNQKGREKIAERFGKVFKQ